MIYFNHQREYSHRAQPENKLFLTIYNRRTRPISGKAKKMKGYYDNGEGAEVASQCPECGELNKSGSEQCENCGEDLTA
jgi:methionyl-tRNA synthetase